MDTRQIFANIVKTYANKRDFLNFVSTTLLKSVVESYYRFIRAHKMIEILSKKGHFLILAQIINRYKAVADKIQNNNYSSVMVVKEISFLISLLQVYHITSYKEGIQDATIMLSFKSDITLRIEREYENYAKFLTDPVQKPILIQIKQFTAVLLLKFKHMTFIMFQYHGIAQFANFPNQNYITQNNSIKVYYELMDNMILVPKTCVSFLNLKNCVVHETLKNIRYISSKYMFKRSTYGWYFLQEISAMLKSLYQRANSQTWEQWDLFRDYYYKNLFSIMYSFKSMFNIQDMDAAEDLQNKLGGIIDKAKKEERLEPEQFNLLDLMDSALYEEFLQIKVDYNRYSPIERDPTILKYLEERLDKFFKYFIADHKAMVNDKIKEVISRLNANIHDWVIDIAKNPDVSVFLAHMSRIPDFEQVNIEKTNVSEREELNKLALADQSGKIIFKNQMEEVPEAKADKGT